MNRDEIIKAVKKYIDDDARYALMIKGSWGCGKTFLYENHIVKAIDDHQIGKENPKSNIYFSLYGISNIDDLSKQLLSEFVTNSIKNENCKNITKKSAGIISALCHSITISLPLNGPSVALDLSNVLNGVIKEIDIKNRIICFDDLERCNIPINDLFGYINNLIEHCECKVIILADEDNMGKMFSNTKVEQKYQTVLTGGRKVVENISKGYEKDLEKKARFEKGEITIDELKGLTEKIFSYNYLYRDIKEKVIGKTCDYTPNTESVLSELIGPVENEMAEKGSYKAFLREHIKVIGEEFSKCRCSNFRIIDSWIRVYREIYDTVRIKCNNFKYIDKINDEFIKYSIHYYVSYKTNDDNSLNYTPGYRTHYISLTSGWRFPENHNSYYFIDKYIKSYFIDEKELIDEMGFLEKRFDHDSFYMDADCKKECSGKAYDKCRNWRMLEDEEVIATVDEMIKELGENRYPFDYFSDIIFLLFELKDVGLFSRDLSSVKNIMIDLIKQDDNVQLDKNRRPYYPGYEHSEEFDSFFLDITQARLERNRILHQDIIDEHDIYANPDAFCMHCENACEYYSERRSFLGYIDLFKLVSLINISNLEQVYSIADAISAVYSYEDQSEMFINDATYLASLKTTIDDIVIAEDVGITRKLAIEYLKEKVNALIERCESAQRNVE